MPRDKSIQKVLVIGSGPIVIGQAAEFDYAGTQACRALKAEKIKVVLVNSNPATIMTDVEMADRVYLEPLSVDVLKNVISKEKPDSILPTLGGQTGLNLAVELAETGFLEEHNVRLLGTTVDTIRKAEDRELFKETMEAIGEPIIDSVIVENVADAMAFAASNGYPVIVRPAYTLGGTGGGIAETEEELQEIAAAGIRASRVNQILVEKSVAGWKEIEYEVMRDSAGNCVCVCNMENVDPVGIHTGDSIVVAPTQTLRAKEAQMLKDASINIITALNIQGGCNVQFALDTDSMKYYVIEVNPRLSRSSALASKATGFPIAKVATKVAIGYTFDEIVNGITGKTYACFEPTIDYVVCKFPRWPFDKFTQADKHLGTRMKATGEVMSIGANFEMSFLKAVRSLELGYFSTEDKDLAALTCKEVRERLTVKDDKRMFCVCEALRRGVSVSDINGITKIDPWFLHRLQSIVREEETVKSQGLAYLTKANLRRLKQLGFSDRALAIWCGADETEIRGLRKKFRILPTFKMVDTCAAEVDAVSPYYYSTYDYESEAPKNPSGNTVVVLGSGPIRIGQGVEFDYCSVHCIWALKKAGYEAVIINNNPETVSTDFDTSDRLYFEPLTSEEVWNVLEVEKPKGVVVQFGGQTAIKLAKYVRQMGYKILGTSLDSINAAEDREEFDALLTKLGLQRPAGHTVFTAEQAVQSANELGYPVLVRPSYVLGGQGMEIAYGDAEIREYMGIVNANLQEHPILIDKCIMGTELEVDAICDGKNVLIPGIMQHVERTGIHSGDSIAVYPARDVDDRVGKKLVDITKKLAVSLKTKGLINVQYILREGEIFIIEVNPRSSRTVPYISKVTGIPMVQLAVRCALGEKLEDLGFGKGLYKKAGVYAVKAPVFSNEKIPDLEISLSPEMKSTGEVLGISRSYEEALLKALCASNIRMKREGAILVTVSDGYKKEIVPIADGFSRLGYDIYATSGTAHLLNLNFVPASVVDRVGESEQDILHLIKSGRIQLVINTPTHGRDSKRDGFVIRRTAVEQGIPCLTSVDTAEALLKAIKLKKTDKDLQLFGLHELTQTKE